MRNINNMFCTEIKKELCNWKLYFSIAVYILLCFYVRSDYGKGGALRAIDNMLSLSNTITLISILAAFPTACTFSEDWENGYYKFIVSRSSQVQYIITKILVCAISTFCVSFVSFSIFGLIEYALTGPGTDVVNEGWMFYDLVNSRYNILYIFIRSGLLSLVLALFSEYGLMGSAIMPNKFVAIAFPLISSIILREISFRINYGDISIHKIESASMKTPGQCIIAFVTLVVLALIANVIFSYFVKRRIRCEIN